MSSILSKIDGEDSDLIRMIRLDVGWTAGEVEDPIHELNFFTTRILPIYQSGQLPCGWQGKRISRNWAGNSLADLPAGKIVVF